MAAHASLCSFFLLQLSEWRTSAAFLALVRDSVKQCLGQSKSTCPGHSLHAPAMQDKPPRTDLRWPWLFVVYAVIGSYFALMVYGDRLLNADSGACGPKQAVCVLLI